MSSTLHARFVGVALLVMFAAGCVHVTYAHTGESAPAARAENAEVRFYVSKRPECPYDEIGVLRGTGPLADVYPALRVKARQVGADALIVTGGGLMTTVLGSEAQGGVHSTTADVVEAVAVVLRCPTRQVVGKTLP